MEKLENTFFVISAVLFAYGALADDQKIINLSLFVLVLMVLTYFFGYVLKKYFPKGGQSPVFVETAPDLSNSPDEAGNENKVDNPWAQCVDVDYDKYLAMKDKCIADIRELPNQDTPQFMWFGGSWSPRDLAQQIEDQTTVGKKYVEMMVRAEEDDDEEDANDT